MEFRFGWLRRNEIKEAAKIEWYSVERFWKEYDFSLVFEFTNPRHVIPLVCRVEDKPNNEKLIGYCIYKRAEDSFNVLNLVVHPEYRRLGVGRLFIKNLMYNLNKSKKHHIKVRVRDSDRVDERIPHLFLNSFDFELKQIVPDFYCNYDKLGNVIGKENAMEYYRGK